MDAVAGAPRAPQRVMSKEENRRARVSAQVAEVQAAAPCALCFSWLIYSLLLSLYASHLFSVYQVPTARSPKKPTNLLQQSSAMGGGL